MNLAIDIGNTSLKKASFSDSKFSNIKHLDYSKNNIKKTSVFFEERLR